MQGKRAEKASGGCMPGEEDWFEKCLEQFPDLPSVVLIRSVELKNFPREHLREPLLDLCCGDGFIAECLGLKRIQGCDIDGRAVGRAARREGTYENVLVGDARTLKDFPDAAFLTVISNCALEHVDGIDQALLSVARVLKPDGRLIMSVPGENLNRWFFPGAVMARLGLSKCGRLLCDEYNRKQQHLNILPLSAWNRKLEHSGLALERKFYLFGRQEYALITFFESFITDSFPGPLLRRAYSLLRKVLSVSVRKSLWRGVLKPVYRTAMPLDDGGELFIIARKKESVPVTPSAAAPSLSGEGGQTSGQAAPS